MISSVIQRINRDTDTIGSFFWQRKTKSAWLKDLL